MFKFKNSLLLALVCFLFVTCKKEQLQPNNTVNQPVFMFTGNINFAQVSYRAGVNNYYMNSSYAQDANNVYNFMGTLQSTASLKNSIQFVINDYKVSGKGASAVIDSSLVPALYSIEKPGGTVSRYSTSFIPVMVGMPVSYLWNFGDGSTSSSNSPTHIYAHPGNYHTSLSVNLSSCGNMVDSNIYKMGTPDANTYISLLTVNHDAGDPPLEMTLFCVLYRLSKDNHLEFRRRQGFNK